jgi:DNA-binding CsgD family transcriptional regulator/tetratricopeptide (TPR) repeat protein
MLQRHDDAILHEREDAMDTLLSAYQSARCAKGRLILIDGEAGIGKTTLIQRFCAQLSDAPDIHWGWNDPYPTPRPLGALQDIGATLDMQLDEMIEKGSSQDQIFASLLKTLMSVPKPNILIIEDLHWADQATVDLVRFLGRRISLLRVLAIITLRRGELEQDHAVNQILGDLPAAVTGRIELQPLSPDAVTALAGNPDRGRQIYATTLGNPFFVTELLADGLSSNGHAPASVRDAVWARWSRLPDAMRDFLDLFSMLPSGATRPFIAALVGPDGERIAEQCVERDLLRYDEQGMLIFRHDLARQATQERLSQLAQRDFHTRIATALGSMPHAQSDTRISAQRLHHVTLSGDMRAVLDLAPRVASRAASMGAHQQAANYLREAIKHVALSPPEIAAQLYENWAQETFLANVGAPEDAVQAFGFAIALWRSQLRIDKVGLNLCRLARLHWRHGETERAVDFTEQAVCELEPLGPTPELALAYSTRSQFLMLQDRFSEAIAWGRRAMDLSDQLNHVEIRAHALNNVGTALMMTGGAGGDRLLDDSLRISLDHGFHDHASRAYTNYAECRMIERAFEAADVLMTEGISFCAQHDLDPAVHYLLGRHAQLRMEQGRFHEAETIANGVLQKSDLPRVMRLPAMSVLGRVRARLGVAGANDLLQRALEEGLVTGEPQRIIPVRLSLVELAWLCDDIASAITQLDALGALEGPDLSGWDLGELLVWRRRCGLSCDLEPGFSSLPAQRLAELEGGYDRASQLWLELQQPYESALVAMQGSATMLAQAVVAFDAMGAKPAATLARRRAQQFGMDGLMPKVPRGPYASARRHPLGLTTSEQKVLSLLVQGLSNKEIAIRLSRSTRTIEHQVSAVLSKFSANNRMEVLLRVTNEPYLKGDQV